MARPFPTTFEKDQSPLSPMSAGSASNAPISYRANVNRNKTKKWADAKPVDYGGDDWGDDDEYDLPPPPIPKPTGLRHQGQAIQPGPLVPHIDNKKNYGELPPLPGSVASSSSRPRANSFDADDERRNFSSGTPRHPSQPVAVAPAPAPAPATRFSQITGQPSIRDPSGPPALSIQTQQPQPAAAGLRKPIQVPGVSPVAGSPHPDILLPGPIRANTAESSRTYSPIIRTSTGESGSVYSQPSDTRTPSSDYQARRDFSPTAVPAPLSTRVSPAPQSATDTPVAVARFPARKSSLSQSTGPDLSEIVPPAQSAASPKPWVGGASTSPGPSARTPTTPSSKALPFIRPADIYRRVEEEKERERQSMDSSRPSMDSIVGAKSSDRSDSPAKQPLRERSSSDSLGRQRTSFDRDEASDPSRRLMPMLESVRERKSEYGFEEFNVKDHTNAPAPTELAQAPGIVTQLGIEEERRSSISPKLPDLNRISGFGMDIFSLPKPKAAELLTPQEARHTPAMSNVESPPEDDSTLPRQTSLGFRSAVSQAFDRKDDSSVPPTPASQTGSDVRRTDSESTGTTGISPIMSSGPSGAVFDGRYRDASGPSILEVVHEPSSPAMASERMAADLPQTMKNAAVPIIMPGHRRNVSTPSPGNSPARTPDLAKIEAATEGHEVVLSGPASPDISTQDTDEEPLQPPRPIAERESSFRPNLPGSWTSFTATATSETPHSSRASKEVERTQTPAAQDLTHEPRNEDDHDLTPTTKHPLLQSGAAAGVALEGAAEAPFSRHDEASPVRSPPPENALEVRGNGTLPTPDPTMAPSGNVYSATPLDPRLLPKLESVSPESQLRPAPINEEISTESSAAPTPPDKNTPVLTDDNSGRFPNPPVTLNQMTLDQVEEGERLEPPIKQHVLPTLSINDQPQDEQNNKLHQDIVKSSSPRTSGVAPRDEHFLSDPLDDQTTSNEGRFSSYLPKEYDNYWASTSEDADLAPLAIPPATKPTEQPTQFEVPPSSNPNTVAENSYSKVATPPIEPMSTDSANVTTTESRPPMQHRFSWEASVEDVSLARSREEIPEMPTSDPHQFQNTEVQRQIENDSPEVLAEPTRVTEEHDLQSAPPESGQDGEALSLRSPVSEISETGHAGRDAAFLAGGAALIGGATVDALRSHPTSFQQQRQPDRQLPLAEEQDPQVSSYPISPIPLDEGHLSRSPQPYFSTTDPAIAQQVPSTAPSSVSPINTPLKTQFSTTSRILAFKEIAAMKSPQQRIQTFDETRHRFAAMDSGLMNWISNLKAQHPEYTNATGSWGGATVPVPNASARSKFTKATGAGPPPQQAYYQQYLNASPIAPGTPVSRPGPSTPVGSQQGFSPAGGKLSSHQVQAKGKELLHTAGIFGGKAGKAGKGLLAKGKNKLRGSGAGDKTSASPPAKPKTERRTSWGFPLALPRSSGRPDASSRQSGEITPMQTPERQRAAGMNSERGLPAFLIPTTTSGESIGFINGAPSKNNLGVGQPNEPTTSRGLREQTTQNDNESERLETLGIPAPIAKNQPSWDPLNATPIAEEDGFQYDERPKQDTSTLGPAPRLAPLALHGDPTSESDRSNSGDALFFDAPEEQPDLHDWVLVSPEPESKPVQDKMQPEVARAPTEPGTSILDRPRYSYEFPTQEQALNAPTQPRPRYSYEDPREEQTPAPATQGQNIPLNYPPVQQHFDQNTRIQQMEQEQEPGRNGSFKGLPPIRRSSTFGLGFGSRRPRQRFSIDDEEDVPSPISYEQDPEGNEAEISGAAGAAGAATMAAYEEDQSHREHQQPIHAIVTNDLSHQHEHAVNQSNQLRPELVQAHSSDYSQGAVKPQPEHQPDFQVPRVADVPPEDFRRSQDSWRPNATAPPPEASPPSYGEVGIIPQHPLLRGKEHSRGMSQSSEKSFTQRPDVQYNDRLPRAISNQPPSSAQRYPDLFQPPQPAGDLARDEELPAHYYQTPIPREAAFLPRQQTNEYQLPGVGPPADEPRSPAANRNSGFFKEIGERLSRGTSRERRNSLSQGGMPPPERPRDSRGFEYPESSVASDEAGDQNQRRSSFFGNLTRGSTSGLGPPHSRESVVAHFPASRTDLLNSAQHSPVGPGDRKRSFFGNSSNDPRSKLNKLTRSSTSGMSDHEPGKKKRFSGLSSMFGRSGHSSRGSLQEIQPQQASREPSYNERQPIESPQFDQRQTVGQPPPSQQPRAQSQQRRLLTRLTTSRDPSKPRQESRTRRPSASNMLSGIMGRRSHQQERKEDSSSQGTRSQASQPQHNPHQMPLGRTYTDLQEQSQQAPPLQQAQQPRNPDPSVSSQPQERGRRTNRGPPREIPREPQYDSVPIPGGYTLVRGEGTMTMPTQYDPRGLNHLQQQVDPQYVQPMGNYQRGPERMIVEQQRPQPQSEVHRASAGQMRLAPVATPPTLGPSENYASRPSPRRLSREDLLARSPAREQQGQQRPYQLSLPEDEEDREDRRHITLPIDREIPVLKPPNGARLQKAPPIAQPQAKKQQDAIQRLQQPVLRHPESPAGYPLPDDSVFSPINEAARDIPPPPPPKWPAHMDSLHQKQNLQPRPSDSPSQSTFLSLGETDLDRSNTRRTAVSAVSGMSGPGSPGYNGNGLGVPRDGIEGASSRQGITPSPTPPSRTSTPDLLGEKDLESGMLTERGRIGGGKIKTTTMERRAPSPDLYTASPRLPPVKNGDFPGNGDGNGVHAANTHPQNVNIQGNVTGTVNGKESNKTKTFSSEGLGNPIPHQRANAAQEEKIFYDPEGHGSNPGAATDDEEEGATMSATSYPGQEWNPYGSGAWEEGFD